MKYFSYLFVFLLALFSNVFSAPTDLPLVQRTDITYLGSFALPTDINGTSRFGYGGLAVTPYTDPQGRRTLYIAGHIQQGPNVAQVQIPSTFSKSSDYNALPRATFLQSFANVVDGDIRLKSGITTFNGTNVYGMLAYNSRLIVASGEYYGCSQQYSHGASNLNLSFPNDFLGFYRINSLANARTVGGPMVVIPPEWRTLFGGPVLTGNWGTIAIVSCNSAGPSLTVFDPDRVGFDSVVTGNTILHYPLNQNENRTLCEGVSCSSPTPEATTNNLYNLATRYGGVAFPSGTRSVILFGRHGTGTYCYGTPQECFNDPADNDSKGPHAYPYRYQIWAYDANDLVAVRNGTLKTYQPRPYAVWQIDDLNHVVAPGFAKIVSAGYDHDTRRLYVVLDYGERPRVEVFEIKALSVTSPPEKKTYNVNHNLPLILE